MPFDLLITGVGGTGVVTIGALVTMAAHLEGKGSSVLDFTGFAQKFGPVLSYVRIGETPEAINQVRIDSRAADALIGCDIVVSSSPKASAAYREGMRAAVNLAEMPTGDIVLRRDASLSVDSRLAAIAQVTGEDALGAVNANRLSEKLMGDSVFANVMMLGFAWQMGLVPVSLNALSQAIELNGVAVEANHRALLIGRIAQANPDALRAALEPRPVPETLDQLIAKREAFLSDYQDAAYAARYRRTVDAVREQEAVLGTKGATEAVARALFKLMAYKDEYEVARLHTQAGFSERLGDMFEGNYRIVHHMAPPILNGERDARGRPRKRAFGLWFRVPLHLLAKLKGLRGTAFDPFGYTHERKMERQLIDWYQGLVSALLPKLSPVTHAEICEILAAPLDIRGYGPVKEQAAKRVRSDVEVRKARLL